MSGRSPSGGVIPPRTVQRAFRFGRGLYYTVIHPTPGAHPVPIKTLTVGGTVYHLTLAGRFRPHTPAELQAIKESVRAGGIRRDVRTYRDTTLGLDNCVLDGIARLTVAKDLGLDAVPVKKCGSLTTEEAYREAIVHNDHRRHDSPEELQKRRRERVERVAGLRAAGKSLPVIAELEGVSIAQVRRDLDEHSGLPGGKPEPKSEGAGVLGGTPAPAPAATTGKDGKAYRIIPAKAAPAPAPTPAPTPAPPPQPAKPVPAALRATAPRPAFDWAALEVAYLELRRLTDAAAAHHGESGSPTHTGALRALDAYHTLVLTPEKKALSWRTRLLAS